jgi:hypothetical protein
MFMCPGSCVNSWTYVVINCTCVDENIKTTCPYDDHDICYVSCYHCHYHNYCCSVVIGFIVMLYPYWGYQFNYPLSDTITHYLCSCLLYVVQVIYWYNIVSVLRTILRVANSNLGLETCCPDIVIATPSAHANISRDNAPLWNLYLFLWCPSQYPFC